MRGAVVGRWNQRGHAAGAEPSWATWDKLVSFSEPQLSCLENIQPWCAECPAQNGTREMAPVAITLGIPSPGMSGEDSAIVERGC